MDFLERFLHILSIPILNFTETTGRLSWIYLLSATGIGFVVILNQHLAKKIFSWKEFLFEVFDFSHWKKKSSVVDYLYYFVETILYTVFFSYFVITSLSVSIFVFKVLFFEVNARFPTIGLYKHSILFLFY